MVKNKYEGKALEELEKTNEQLDKEIRETKDEHVEDIEERKKRLIEQREIIRKAKEAERQQELERYLNKGSSDNAGTTEEEMTRRANIMKKLKERSD